MLSERALGIGATCVSAGGEQESPRSLALPQSGQLTGFMLTRYTFVIFVAAKIPDQIVEPHKNETELGREGSSSIGEHRPRGCMARLASDLLLKGALTNPSSRTPLSHTKCS
jgi:hypothetical protein